MFRGVFRVKGLTSGEGAGLRLQGLLEKRRKFNCPPGCPEPCVS